MVATYRRHRRRSGRVGQWNRVPLVQLRSHVDVVLPACHPDPQPFCTSPLLCMIIAAKLVVRDKSAMSMFHTVLLGSERTRVGWVVSRCRPRKSSRRRTWPSRDPLLRRVLPKGTPQYPTVGAHPANRRDTKLSAQSKHHGGSVERQCSSSKGLSGRAADMVGTTRT